MAPLRPGRPESRLPARSGGAAGGASTPSYSVVSMERTLPWNWYSDAGVLQLEQERIFRGAWQYVGHLGQVAEPGSFFASRAADIPVVVTRARDGELRAFL